MKNKIIVPILALVVTGATLASMEAVNPVHAQTNGGNNPFSNLVQMIAQKFNLNQTDVQGVFDQFKTQRQTKMQDKFNANLDQLVKDGKITDAQKQLIIAKRQELQNNRPDFKNLSPADRKAAMEKQRTDLEAWAKQNNIDLQYLYGVRMGPMHNRGWMK